MSFIIATVRASVPRSDAGLDLNRLASSVLNSQFDDLGIQVALKIANKELIPDAFAADRMVAVVECHMTPADETTMNWDDRLELLVESRLLSTAKEIAEQRKKKGSRYSADCRPSFSNDSVCGPQGNFRLNTNAASHRGASASCNWMDDDNPFPNDDF